MPIIRLRHCAAALLCIAIAAAPVPGAAATDTCGDGLLSAAESCEACPPDCKPAACAPSPQRASFAVDFAPLLGHKPVAATLRIGYRSDRLSLPGSGDEPSVRTRVAASQPGAVVSPNDLGYAVRVVVVRGDGQLQPGPVLAIEFDGCKEAPAPGAGDVSCTVEGCATGGGPIEGCSCQARKL